MAQKIKGKKTALYVLLTYIACQLSSIILLVFPRFKEYLFSLVDAPTREDQAVILSGYWSTISFAIATVIILILTTRDKQFWKVFSKPRLSMPEVIGWGIIGFALVYVGQIIGAQIEIKLFGIEAGSENTANIGEIMRAAPIMILSTVLFAPILEEIIFRRVIFGSLIQKFNFWISAIASGLVFAAIHLEFEHLLLYAICGLVFAFIYNYTRSIIASIISHMMLNGSVTLIQWFYDDIVKWLEQFEEKTKALMIFFS